jgi:hypothetical protein
MSSPTPNDASRTTWVHIEVSLDIDGVLHEYVIEGRPDGGHPHIELDPEYEGDLIPVMKMLNVDMQLKLENPSFSIRSDDDGDNGSPPRLRAV